MRKVKIKRKTAETDVEMALNLDSFKPAKIQTDIPFLNHMLNLFAANAQITLDIKAKGDVEIDDHHLTEDIGITLGQALKKSLGDKKGITRYGHFLLPMDEALAYVAMDISGRPHLSYDVKIKFQKTGFNYDLLQEFFIAFVNNAGVTLHIKMMKGRNNHHIAEAVFKGFGRALKDAVSINKKIKNIPSTKGIL